MLMKQTLQQQPSAAVAAAPAPAPAEDQGIFGRTVADTRALARRASVIGIFYPAGQPGNGYLGIGKKAFLAALKSKSDGDPMPSQLFFSRYTGRAILSIGGYCAIEAAAKAAEGSRDAVAQ
jgi:hypothetical protein